MVLVKIKVFLSGKGPEQTFMFALTGMPHTFIIISDISVLEKQKLGMIHRYIDGSDLWASQLLGFGIGTRQEIRFLLGL